MAEKETRGERVYTELREEILTGRRRPGDRLPTAELCQRFDSSVGVVRESLLQLAEHGLVQSRPMQGFRVTALSQEDLRDLTEARLDIETLALRRSVEQGDAAWESQVVGAHHLLSVTPRQVPGSDERFTAEWARAHGSFHAVLLAGCRNRRLREMAQRLRDSAELYRRWSLPADDEEDRDIAGEHREILAAVLAHDAGLAVERLAAHIRTTDEDLRRDL